MYDYLLFDEINLATIEYLNIFDVSMDAVPEINISSGKLARRDGIKIYHKEYGARKITVMGNITAPSRADVQTVRGTLLKYLHNEEKKLITFDGYNYKEYTATLTNITITDTGGGYARFTLEFTCSDPYGYDLNYTTLLDATNWTNADSNLSFAEVVASNFGSPAEVTITVQGITGGSETGYIKVASQAGQFIQIQRTWEDDDVLTVNSTLKECKVNGLFVDYTGNFFDLLLDESYLNVSTDLTTHNSYVSCKYKQRTL